jgi:DNA-binding transcriptional LysR family regulator
MMMKKEGGAAMNLAFIEGFLETVRLGSIAKASERLNVTHPALSKQLRSLEDYYGVSLLRRTPSGAAPTPAGKRLYERLLPVYRELQAIRSELANLHGFTRLKIGALPSLAAHYLPGKIHALDQKGVQTEVTVRPTSPKLYTLLGEQLLDAAVLELSGAHSAFWSVPLFAEKYYAVVYAGHPLAGKSSVTLEQLSREPLIVNPPDCRIRRWVTERLGHLGETPRIKAEAAYGEFIPGYVAAGAGLAILPQIAADHLNHPSLRVLPIDDGYAFRTIGLAALTEEIGRFLRPVLAPL